MLRVIAGLDKVNTNHVLEIDFTHNTVIHEESFKGITFCDLYIDGERISTGKSTCHRDDNFSKSKGRKLALKRAIEDTHPVYNISKPLREEIWGAYFDKMK